MKLRTGDPWMPAPAYGRSLSGLTVNLLVPSIEAALPFQLRVLAATCVYQDPDIAVLRFGEAEWMLHADHTYDGHPLYGALPGDDLPRGRGAEIRLHGRDPDAAAAEAEAMGFTVLSPAADKPHGLREAHIFDRDGYLWVPDIPSSDAEG